MTIDAAGAFGAIDGVNVEADTVVLVKDEPMGFPPLAINNGVYVCTEPGGVGVQPVFVRADWFDTDEQVFHGAEVRVKRGDYNGGKIFAVELAGAIDVSSILWGYDSGTGIALAVNVSSINAQQKDVALVGLRPGQHAVVVQLISDDSGGALGFPTSIVHGPDTARIRFPNAPTNNDGEMNVIAIRCSNGGSGGGGGPIT